MSDSENNEVIEEMKKKGEEGSSGGDGVAGNQGKVLVSIQPHSPAATLAWTTVQKLIRNTSENYHPSGTIAQRLGITPQGLSRITGSLWVNTGTSSPISY